MGRDVGEWARATNGARYIDKATAMPERGAKRLLERTVRACSVAASDELDFIKRVRHEDVDIEAVSYDRGRGRGLVTGYRVRLAGKESERWYGGGRIAKDLTLPALRASGNWPTSEVTNPELGRTPPHEYSRSPTSDRDRSQDRARGTTPTPNRG